MLFCTDLARISMLKINYFCIDIKAILSLYTVWIKYEKHSLIMKRIAIYPKDIMIITGKGESYSRKLLRKIKTHFNKEPHQFVSFEEFYQYTGLKSGVKTD
jgi:hypothetical protein